MKDYEYKLETLLRQQGGGCYVCSKQFTPFEKIDLAHRVKASNFNYKRFGEDVIDHILNLRATHPGKCNDACNMSRAAHPVEAQELIDRIEYSIINE
jgi:hypothetical protein